MTKSSEEDLKLLQRIREDRHYDPFMKELSRRAGEAKKVGDSREYFFNKIWLLLSKH